MDEEPSCLRVRFEMIGKMARMEYRRADRIADLLQQEIADLLFRRVKDPRVAGVTITGVEVSADLQHARVFFCVMGSTDKHRRETALQGLNKAQGFIRQQLGKRIHMRYLPKLAFAYDASFEYGEKMDRLLKELHQDE